MALIPVQNFGNVNYRPEQASCDMTRLYAVAMSGEAQVLTNRLRGTIQGAGEFPRSQEVPTLRNACKFGRHVLLIHRFPSYGVSCDGFQDMQRHAFSQ
jgi:hypothetical protein